MKAMRGRIAHNLFHSKELQTPRRPTPTNPGRRPRGASLTLARPVVSVRSSGRAETGGDARGWAAGLEIADTTESPRPRSERVLSSPPRERRSVVSVV